MIIVILTIILITMIMIMIMIIMTIMILITTINSRLTRGLDVDKLTDPRRAPPPAHYVIV